MYSDKVLDNRKEDLLGRYNFAEQIAHGLVHSISQDKNSFVLGITGSWGTGKSSLLNFILAEVELLHKETDYLYTPIIIKFNPWMFSGQKELQLVFLKQLYSKFNSFNSTLEQASKSLQKFVEKLGWLKYVHQGVHELVKDTKEMLEPFNFRHLSLIDTKRVFKGFKTVLI